MEFAERMKKVQEEAKAMLRKTQEEMKQQVDKGRKKAKELLDVVHISLSKIW